MLSLAIVLGTTLLLLSSWAQPSEAHAQTGTPTPAPTATPATPGGVVLSFTQLGQDSFQLRSPVSSEAIFFNLPYRWVVTSGSGFINLHYDFTFEETALPGTPTPDVASAVVEVTVDDVVATTFIPTAGTNQTIRLAIPPSALAPDPFDTEHVISVSFFSTLECDLYSTQTAIMTVHNDSSIGFDYTVQPIQIDLADLPRPLSQGLFAAESVVLVVPDDYTAADLEAAAAAAAGLGKRTFGALNFSLIPASEANATSLANASAVIIGTPTRNAFLAGLYERRLLPTQLDRNRNPVATRSGNLIGPDDGVVQEIASQYSRDHVFLVVTGSNDEGVLRAARSLSATNPLFAFRGDVVVISAVTPLEAPNLPSGPVTLEALGMRDQTLIGVATTSSAGVTVFVPAGMVVQDHATLRLSYLHSAAVDPTNSVLTVTLNGERMASLLLSDANISPKEVIIQLPQEFFRTGRNRLTFEATMYPRDVCTLRDALPNIWTSIFGSSTLELPLVERGSGLSQGDLGNPLDPFASSPSLATVWLSLPASPTREELQGMVQVASVLGAQASGGALSPRVSLGEIPDMQAQLAPYNVMAFGLPSANPVIAAVNENLPQPFVPGENALQQEIGNITYRLPDNYSVGLVELIPSPWNPTRVVAVVTGTTQQGVGWAIRNLTEQNLFTNLSIIGETDFEALEASDILRGATGAVEAVTGQQAELEAVQATPSAAVPQLSQEEINVQYASPPGSTQSIALISLGLVGLGVVFVGANLLLRRRKHRKQSAP